MDFDSFKLFRSPQTVFLARVESEPEFVNLLSSPGIDSRPVVPGGITTLCDVPAHQATYAGRIDSLESIPRLLKRLQIRAQSQSGKRLSSLPSFLPALEF